MPKKLLMIAMCLCVFSAQANVSPITVNFKENEKVSLKLSGASYNKILINNEKITDFYYVDGDFIVADTNDLDEFVPKDDGSIYIVPQSDKKSVIYLTTNRGHHVALEVDLDDKSGQIVALEYGRFATPITAKNSKAQPSKAKEILRALVSNKLQGASVSNQAKEQRINDIAFKLIKSYQKDNYKALVFEAKNVGQKTIKISPALFSEKNTKAISLENEVLEPNQSTYVYSVIGDNRHA